METATQQQVVGLIPAGGQATRIFPLPCSKELYPIGFSPRAKEGPLCPKVVFQYLLEKMRAAGITKAYIVLREGKWDIPAYLRDGIIADMHIAYLMLGAPFGVPYTLDQAYPFVLNATVAFGFPDILFESENAFARLLARQAATDATVVLGLFPADRPEKVDMVDLAEDGRIRRLVIKPRQTHLCCTWGIAVWTPLFTSFLHEYVATRKAFAAAQPELFIGQVIEAAIHDGLRVETVLVSTDPYLDIGTPEDLVKAARKFNVE